MASRLVVQMLVVFTSQKACAAFTPSIVGQARDLFGNSMQGAQGVAVLGDYAYVAAKSYDGLTIVYIKDPVAPTITASISDPQLAGASAVAVIGIYAYVATAGYGSLTTVNIADPTNPTIAGSVNSSELAGANDIYIDGNYAYIAASTYGGLTVVSLIDPTSPTIAGTVAHTFLEGTNKVVVAQGVAYMTQPSGSGGWRTVDVTNPTAPAMQHAFAIPWASAVAVDPGNYVYITDFNEYLTIYNIDASLPNFIPPYVTSSSTELVPSGTALAVVDGYAYIGNLGEGAVGLTIVNVSDPASPVIEHSLTDYEVSLPDAIVVSGLYAYLVSSSESALTIVQIKPLPTTTTRTTTTSASTSTTTNVTTTATTTATSMTTTVTTGTSTTTSGTGTTVTATTVTTGTASVTTSSGGGASTADPDASGTTATTGDTDFNTSATATTSIDLEVSGGVTCSLAGGAFGLLLAAVGYV